MQNSPPAQKTARELACSTEENTACLPYQVPQLGLILPVGISFYTFQTMSYTIDVNRGAAVVHRRGGQQQED